MDALDSIAVLFARGTHYQIGFQVGKRFQSQINEFYSSVGELDEQWVPYYNTPQGKELYNGYLQVVKEDHPQYLLEVQGISDGANIPFFKVFLMHIRKELQMISNMESAPECSTVFVNSPQTRVICHNEDTAPEARQTGYVLVCDIHDEDGESCEKFMSYAYPGIIPGNSINYTGNGLALTVNALYPQLVLPDKTPRQFVNRAMLAAKDLNHLDSILLDESRGIATGCSVNVASLTDSRMYNKELCPQSSQVGTVLTTVTINPEKNDHDEFRTYNHFNAYKHTDIVQAPGFVVSSQHRQARADLLKNPENLRDALVVLGDNEDGEYPIYRVPSKTDSGCTVATGVINLLERTFTLYSDNPKTSPGPLVRLPFSVLD